MELTRYIAMIGLLIAYRIIMSERKCEYVINDKKKCLDQICLKGYDAIFMIYGGLCILTLTGDSSSQEVFIAIVKWLTYSSSSLIGGVLAIKKYKYSKVSTRDKSLSVIFILLQMSLGNMKVSIIMIALFAFVNYYSANKILEKVQ